QANEEAAQSGGAEQEPRRSSRSVHDFRNIEWTKYILQKEPGDEPAGAHAAKPNVAKSQNRKITLYCCRPRFPAIFFSTLWLANEFPDQECHQHARQSGHEESPPPAPSRCYLSRQDGRGTKTHQRSSANHQTHIPSAAARSGSLSRDRIDHGPARSFCSTHERADN